MDSPTWDTSLADMEPAGFMEAGWAPLWAYGFNGILPGLCLLLAVVKILIAWRRKRRADGVEDSATEELAPGDAVLKGTVVEVEDSDVAVRLTVEQYGTAAERGDKNKRWYTTWTEIDRQLETHSFFLELASGKRVRIEPDEDTKLVDDLEPLRTEGNSRYVAAQLTPGEVMYAVGELVESDDAAGARGYRGGGKTLVMRKPEGGHLLLSTHRLGAQFTQEGRLWKTFAIVLVVAAVVVHALGYEYHAAFFFGRAEAAKVVSRRDWVEDKGSKDESHHYEIGYEVVRTGRQRKELVEGDDYPKLTMGRVFPVNHVRILGSDRYTVGAGATAHGAVHFFPALVLGAIMAFFLWMIAGSKPWFLQERLVEEVEGKHVP